MTRDPAHGNPNFAFSTQLFEELVRCGVEHVVISPGSRSAPLATAAWRQPALRCWSQIDERSGAFFALGLAKATRAPVAVVCTSGTAAVNLHPAVVEAHHARVPLLMLTADRPPELRDWGAGQTIDQVRLYGSAVRWFAEVPVPELGDSGLLRSARALARRAVASARGRPAGPVHLNLPFREPLAPTRLKDGAGSAGGELARSEPAAAADIRVEPGEAAPSPELVASLLARLRSCERGVVVCGPLDAEPETAESIARLAAALGWPLLADAASQLRRGPHAEAAPLIATFDLFLRDPATARRLAPRGVLRFGDSPTSKALRLWLEEHLPESFVLVDPDGVWHDPGRLASEVLRVHPRALCDALLRRTGEESPAPSPWLRAFLAAEQCTLERVERELGSHAELLEARAVRELDAALPEDALLYVSSSMPIRDVDSFLPPGASRLRILCNRGANGIDGVVSSAIGASAAGATPVVLLTGDLAFLHDAGGLLAAARHGLRATLVVLDNDGGGIFSFLPIAAHGAAVGFEDNFRTPHGLDLAAVASAYGARAVRIDSWEHFATAFKEALAGDRVQVLVIPVDRDRNVAQHREIEHAVATALKQVAWPL